MEAQDVAVKVGTGATRGERRVRGVSGRCALFAASARPSLTERKARAKFRDCVLGVSPPAECSKPGRKGHALCGDAVQAASVLAE
jgi:hypothetical protein